MKLTSIEMFKDLTNMELAKLLGMLDKRQLAAGASLFEQGDIGDQIFIIERGAIELFVSSEIGVKRSLAVLGEGEVFGEMALLTGEARSAAAVAVVDTWLFVIDRKTFDRLVAENAVFSAYFIKLLSQRLIATNGHLQEAKETESQRVLQELSQLPEEMVRFLLWCTHIPYVSRGLIEHIYSFSLEAELASPILGSYFQSSTSTSEWIKLQPRLAPILADICKNKYGYEEMQRWIESAAAWYQSKGSWVTSIQIQGEKDNWQGALDTYIKAFDQLSGDKQQELFISIKSCPRKRIASNYTVLQTYLPYCEEHDPEEGLAVLEMALNSSAVFTPSQLLFLYERGMGLYQRANRQQQALKYMQLADGVASSLSESQGEAVNDDRALGLAKQKLARKRSELLVQGTGSWLKGNHLAQLLAIIVALLCIVFSFVMKPVGGLSEAEIRFIGIALAAVIMWIIAIIPNYIVALGMIMLWVLSGVATPEIALSGYGSNTWLFMIFIMAISAVVTKSGISYRFALHALKRFPSHYRGQLWGIVAGGTLLNPLLPSSSAKVSLGVPMAQTIADSMGFDDRSKGTAGLGLVAMIFFGFTAPFVMTGSYTNVMAYGIASAEKKVSWLQWFLYALPAFVIFGAVLLGLLFFMFRRITPAKMVTKEVLNEQLQLLGPLTKEERISLWTIICCIGLMALQPLHGVDSTWIMLLGFAVLVISGVLDKQTISTGIDWTFLLFLGAAFSFAAVAQQLQIADRLSSFLSEHMSLLTTSPVLFLIAVVLISFVVTLIIRDDPAVILLVTALVPLGQSIGIHPWVLVFLILLATDPFFFSYQSPTYLTAYYSTEGKAFTHRQAQRVAIGYGIAILLVVVLCVPYWKWLSLIP